MFDFWCGGVRCEMVTYWLISVRERDVSFSARAAEGVPDFFPIWVKNLPCKHKPNIRKCTPTYIRPIATYSVEHKDTHNAAPSPLVSPLLFSFQSLPSPPLSLVGPISRLAVTLSPHESQYGSRVLWTAAAQTTTTKPYSLYTATHQNH